MAIIWIWLKLIMFLPNLEHETREYALMHLLVLCAKFEYQKIYLTLVSKLITNLHIANNYSLHKLGKPHWIWRSEKAVMLVFLYLFEVRVGMDIGGSSGQTHPLALVHSDPGYTVHRLQNSVMGDGQCSCNVHLRLFRVASFPWLKTTKCSVRAR